MTPRMILLGPPRVGKTTIATLLAAAYGCPAVALATTNLRVFQEHGLRPAGR
jgi:replication-associated recombination protein RarA